jgi:hypothetical protein
MHHATRDSVSAAIDSSIRRIDVVAKTMDAIVGASKKMSP